jgi:hypothetical protein
VILLALREVGELRRAITELKTTVDSLRQQSEAFTTMIRSVEDFRKTVAELKPLYELSGKIAGLSKVIESLKASISQLKETVAELKPSREFRIGTVGIALESISKDEWGPAYFPELNVREEVHALEDISKYMEVIIVDVNKGVTEYRRSTAGELSKGTPVARLNRYTGSDQTYQEVVKWTVSTGKKGSLKEISMYSDNFEKTFWKLTIAGKVQFEDKVIPATLTLPFPDNELSEGDTVLIECKSADGTLITVDGSISGKEY